MRLARSEVLRELSCIYIYLDSFVASSCIVIFASFQMLFNRKCPPVVA